MFISHLKTKIHTPSSRPRRNNIIVVFSLGLLKLRDKLREVPTLK
jgi:hypothetical protein